MHRVVIVTPLPNYRLAIEFSDGASGTVDLSHELHGEMFAPLREHKLFNQVEVDEYGAVTWPNGADLAPDALYDELAAGSPASRPSAPQLSQR